MAPSITNPGEIIAALPAILGYTVTNSIVVAVTGHDDERRLVVQAAMRVSIDSNTTGIGRIGHLAQQIGRNPAGVIIIGVAGPEHAQQCGDLIDATTAACRAAGLPIIARLSVPTTAEPAPWVNIDTSETGHTTAMTDTGAAAHAVLQGRTIAATREAIADEFQSAEPAAPTITLHGYDEFLTAAEQLTAILAGTQRLTTDIITPDLVGTLAAVITHRDRRMRDALLLLGIDHCQRSAQVWTELARTMRGTARIEALTIAAACYYMDADGPRANVALETLITEADQAGCTPTQFALLLDIALSNGIHPAKIRDVVAKGGMQAGVLAGPLNLN